MASEAVLEITSENFEQEVVQSDVPVVLDFWAEWCPPCLAIAPLIDQLAEAYAGRVKVGKVNTQYQEELANQFNIATIPTLLVMKDGQEVRRMGSTPFSVKTIVDELNLDELTGANPDNAAAAETDPSPAAADHSPAAGD